MFLVDILEKIVDRYNTLSPLYKVIVMKMVIIMSAVITYNLISPNAPFRVIHW